MANGGQARKNGNGANIGFECRIRAEQRRDLRFIGLQLVERATVNVGWAYGPHRVADGGSRAVHAVADH